MAEQLIDTDWLAGAECPMYPGRPAGWRRARTPVGSRRPNGMGSIFPASMVMRQGTPAMIAMIAANWGFNLLAVYGAYKLITRK